MSHPTSNRYSNVNNQRRTQNPQQVIVLFIEISQKWVKNMKSFKKKLNPTK